MDQVAGAKIFWIPVSDKFKVQMRCEAALKASSAADTQGSRNRGRRGEGGGTAVKHFLTQERKKKPATLKRLQLASARTSPTFTDVSFSPRSSSSSVFLPGVGG